MFLDSTVNQDLEEAAFQKDVQALIDYAEINNINLNTLSGAWKTNLELRPDKDWESLVGRAVTKK